MGLKEDVLEMKKEVESVKNQSLVWELLKDSKEANKRICTSFTIVITLILILWSLTIGYLIYILNDIGVEHTTTESYEMNAEGSNNFINGDNNGEIKN